MSTDFEASVRSGDTKFAAKDYAAARAHYLRAIDIEPTNPDALGIAIKIETSEEMMSSRDWYGDTVPAAHAVALLGSASPTLLRRPYLHNIYYGRRAYDAFHTAAYMEELVRQRRFQTLLQSSFVLLYLSMLAIGNDEVEFN